MEMTGVMARHDTAAIAGRRFHPAGLLILGACVLLCALAVTAWWLVVHPQLQEEPLAAGEHVYLSSGMAFTVPARQIWSGATRGSVNWHAGWLYTDSARWTEQINGFPAARTGLPVVVFLSYPGGPWDSLGHMRFAFESGAPPLAYSSPDGQTKAYWKDGGRDLLIVTRASGRSTGVIMLLGLPLASQAPDAGDVNKTLATVWRQLSIRGLAVPVLTRG